MATVAKLYGQLDTLSNLQVRRELAANLRTILQLLGKWEGKQSKKMKQRRRRLEQLLGG